MGFHDLIASFANIKKALQFMWLGLLLTTLLLHLSFFSYPAVKSMSSFDFV